MPGYRQHFKSEKQNEVKLENMTARVCFDLGYCIFPSEKIFYTTQVKFFGVHKLIFLFHLQKLTPVLKSIYLRQNTEPLPLCPTVSEKEPAAKLLNDWRNNGNTNLYCLQYKQHRTVWAVYIACYGIAYMHAYLYSIDWLVKSGP